MATGAKGPLAPLLIGLAGGSHRCGAPLTGFAMNPARDFGPKLFTFLNAGLHRHDRWQRDSLLPRTFDCAGHRWNPGAAIYRYWYRAPSPAAKAAAETVSHPLS